MSTRHPLGIETGLWRRAFGVLLLVSCGGGDGPTEPPPTVVTVTVLNGLRVPVSLTAASTAFGTVGSGGSTVLTLPPRTTSLQWAAGSDQYGDGSPIPDDLTGASLSIAQNLGTLDITNVVNGVPYIRPVIASDVADTISFAVAQPSLATPKCIGFMYGTAIIGYPWGYHRLEAGTTIRVHRGIGCHGAYLFWTYDQLLGFQARSGHIGLRVSTLP